MDANCSTAEWLEENEFNSAHDIGTQGWLEDLARARARAANVELIAADATVQPFEPDEDTLEFWSDPKSTEAKGDEKTGWKRSSTTPPHVKKFLGQFNQRRWEQGDLAPGERGSVVSGGSLLAAVRGMTVEQRKELSALLGVKS